MISISKNLFRVLVLLCFGVSIASALVYLWGHGGLPSELQAYMEPPERTRVWKVVLGLLAAGGMVLLVTSIAGLLFFWGPARYITLFLVLSDLVLTVLDPMLEFGWVAALNGLEAVLSGIVLALAFCSPLATFFKKGHRAQNASQKPP